MAKKRIYGLNKRDRDLVNKTIGQMKAGKPALSKRPTPTRRRNRGGIGSHYQIIRGETTDAVTPGDQAFQIEGIQPYEQHSKAPTSPLWVKATSGGVTLSVATAVWAIWRENVLTFDPGSGDVQVDWLMFEPGSTTSPPLRAFELTANKTLASATATAKWLDIDGNMVGDDVTLHDPEHRFSGRIEDDLYSGSNGFRGYALLRTDLAAEDPDQWDIVEMDGLYEIIVAEFVKTSNYPSAGSTTTLEYVSEVDQHGYDRHPPAASAGALTHAADTDIFDPDDYLAEPDFSDGATTTKQVLMKLTDPDTSPPSYRVIEVKGETLRRVAIIDDVTGATWSGSAVTDDTVTVYPFDGSAPSESGSYTATVGMGLESSVTIATGKFRTGYVIGTTLISIQCVEWTLPEGWGE